MKNDSSIQVKPAANSFKYVVLGLLFIGWCLGNVDRNAVGFAVTVFAKEFDLTGSQIGLVISCFFAGYALMQLPGGYLADRFGSRKILLVIVFCWAVFAGLTGAAWSLASLVAFRFMFGLSEGSFMPTATKVVAQVFPRHEHGRAISILLMSSAIVATVSPIIFASVISSMGWRALFYMISLAGVGVIILYYLFLKVDSSDSSAVAGAGAGGNKKRGILKQVLKVPLLWNLFFAGFCATAIIWGLNGWIPIYLIKVRNLNLMQIGWWQMFPNGISIVAMLLSGYIADKLSTDMLKKTTAVLAMLMALSIFLMCSTTQLFMFFLYEGLALAFVSFIMLAGPKLIMKRFKPDVIGSSMGFVNLGSQAGSFTAPLIMGILVDLNDGSFNQAFWYLVSLSVICAVSYLTISTKNFTD